tara:strand:+ start:3710 stop:5281 length:1572 start_codon:yes stop_codon:yes gene_type:complete
MAGGLMQLVAYGAQDVFLTGTPEITFWKVSYRRHTNFAMESIEQTFSGQADFGRRVTCTISRNGDLAYRTYLQVTLPQIDQDMKGASGAVYARWLDFPGEQLIAQVEVEIGGQRIDRQYGDWMHIWNQLTLSKEQQDGYYKMVGNTTQLTYITDPGFANVSGPCAANGGPSQVCAPRNALPETTLYVPLQFWFCRNPGLALPLIALQYHEVKINIDFRPIGECLWAVKDLTGTGTMSVSQAYQQSLVAASLYVDYIFLDTDERRKMAQNPHEYLIEQVQFTGDESVGSSSNKIKLNFNHPCKELVWVVQPDANVDYCASLEGEETLFKTLGAQPFNYTDAIDALPNAVHAFGGLDQTSGANAFITADGLFDMNQAGAASAGASWEGATTAGSSLSDAGTFVLAETALDMHCWGENPVVTAKLQLNGQDRFSEREGSYFDVVQPYQHHTRSPETGINVYSFAVRPEEHQPSGSCNFSRIDNAVLQLVLSAGTVSGTNTAKVRVYAVNYNVLRVMSGMAGPAYSN